MKLTVLLPCVLPKLLPLMPTAVPGSPEGHVRLITFGVGISVKPSVLLPVAPTCTKIFPVAAVDGTVTVIDVSVQLRGVTDW